MTRFAIAAAILLAAAAATASASAAGPERQTVKGTVTALDTESNAVVIQPDQGEAIRVRVTPLQLADLEEGRSLTAHLVRYGERWWLSEAPAGRAEGEDGPRSAVGEVARVSVDDGRLVVDEEGSRRTFQAHPEDIADLEPGQLVSVTYESLPSGEWLREVRGEVELVGATQPVPPATDWREKPTGRSVFSR